MTREEFINELNIKNYSYNIEGNKITVTYNGGNVDLDEITTLPSFVEFNNSGEVWLSILKTIPTGIVFRNKGNVYLSNVKKISPDAVVENEGYVYLEGLSKISNKLIFDNRGEVNLDSIFGGYFSDWDDNIGGIKPNRLLNLMINKGMFI